MSSRLSEATLERASRVRLQQYARAFLMRRSMGLASSFEVSCFSVSNEDLSDVACFSLTFGLLLNSGPGKSHTNPVWAIECLVLIMVYEMLYTIVCSEAVCRVDWW